MLESHTTLRECIEVWGLNMLLFIVAQIVVAFIIHEDDEGMGLLLPLCVCEESCGLDHLNSAHRLFLLSFVRWNLKISYRLSLSCLLFASFRSRANTGLLLWLIRAQS